MTAPAAEIFYYLTEVDKLCRAGNATEHSYRPALKNLFEKITDGLTVTNEPKHIACGAPDYIITKGSIPLGYIEAKDIGADLNGKANKEQFDRYKQSLGNLIITDYLTFQLFVEGEFVISVTLAKVNGSSISPDKKQFNAFLELINQFTKYSGKTIYHSEQLAKMIADKAKLLAEVIKTALGKKEKAEDDTLTDQYESFKKILLHNLDIPEFADIYAQTLAYGLFAARLNQTDGQTFTRYLAAQLIPQSNPFLRKFFYYIAGINLDSRILWIVDALADLFNRVGAEEIKKEFGKADQDPYIHFYETFLAEYDPALREMRGVYYTPAPVVKFIVQAVDDILKNEFFLKRGIADHSKIKRAISDKDGKPQTAELHKVQILDPATGTGTFLAEVIDKIFSYFSNNKGAWHDYCENHLIPRLNGFEILMASYAMAHFKLDMKLKETGYSFKDESRLRIFLTNSLEEPPKEIPELFIEKWLTQEANEASKVKRDAPVMAVLGNPPYNVTSANKSPWIDGLLGAYKLEPNDGKLNEKNSKIINDDYVKFIRYGQYFIQRNGSGILAYINNHSFLDNLTFRGMRWSLLQAFDKIYILDLHGNARKRETAPDSGKDENVFDIQQGVSINIFVKTGKKKDGESAKVYFHEIYGRREEKYRFLLEQTLGSIKWNKLSPKQPHFFFVPKNFAHQDTYECGFGIQDLFPVYISGIKTHNDSDLIGFSPFPSNNQYYAYRPLDIRYINYDIKKVKRPRYKVMRHFLGNENVGIITCRQQSSFDFQHIFIANTIIDICAVSTQTKESAYVFPLYLYPDKNFLDKEEKPTPNLNADIVSIIYKKIGLDFTTEKQNDKNTFAPIDILDYIYAVLYSNKYREKYKEFLKIDFPRVPYPLNAKQFQKLSEIGSLLRSLHLMENVNPIMGLADFPIPGSNEVETVHYKEYYKETKVYINKDQYFENIPSEVWEYYIGGYQPAEKWLKDRKGRIGKKLSFEDIEHYQKIITVLKTTIELQQQIDEVIAVQR